MHLRRPVLGAITILALLLPAVALAQGPTPVENVYSLFATLRGDNDIPPGDPDGFGYARVTINLDENTVCYQLSVARTDPPVAAHIHEGGPSVNGPVVVPFEAPATGLSKGCVDVDPSLAAAIVNSPSGYYVNVHTAVYPPGAVRGQLMPLGWEPAMVPAEDGPTVEVIAEGLNSPRGIDVYEGAVYVAQAGVGGDDCIIVGEGEEAGEQCFGPTGTVSMISDGDVVDVISGVSSFLFDMVEGVGPQDIVVGTDGSVYALVGLGGNPADRATLGKLATNLGWLIEADGAGGYEMVLDIAAYETSANPDDGVLDSNPYSAVMTDDGWVISDAGANALLSVDAAGVISTLAAFANRLVDAPEFLGLPPGTQIPMEPVPTGVTQGPDGAFYVGELTGFPFVPGMARVWRVVPGEEPTVHAEGFTNIIDLAFDADGNLFVLEITTGGLLEANPEDPATLAGALHMVGTGGSISNVTAVSSLLVTPAGMAFGPDGTLYISNLGLFPGMGEVISVSWK